VKKTVLLLLAFLVFVSALVSCGSGDPSQSAVSDQSSAESAISSESSDNSGEPEFNIQKRNYEGKEFIVYATWVSNDHNSEIVENDLTGEFNDFMTTNVNEAIDARNKLTEEHLGVSIREIYVASDRMGGTAMNEIRLNNLAGTLGAHVVAPSIYTLGALAGEDCFVDLNSIAGFNTNASWWDRSFNQTAQVNGKLFFIQGDCGIYGFNATPLVYFNKNIAEELKLPDLYKTVTDNEWTFTKVYEYAKLCSVDLNDDGKMDYNDKMGYAGQADDSWNWFYGSGERIVSENNGILRLSMYNERSSGAIESMTKFFSDRKVYCCANDYFGVSTSPLDLTSQQFIEGRALFFSDNLSFIHRFSGMNDDFGLLPIPKYNKEQESYYSLLNSYSGNAFAIPSVLDEEELAFASECLQTFCYFSTATVKKEYIERTLKYQKTVDDESIDMLNIIFDTRGTDLGFIYNIGSHGNASIDTSLPWLLQALMDGSLSFTSGYEARKEAAQQDLNGIIEMYKNQTAD